jgi:hypothetical protein
VAAGLGGAQDGGAEEPAVLATRGNPQAWQKLASGSLAAPQDVHVTAYAAGPWATNGDTVGGTGGVGDDAAGGPIAARAIPHVWQNASPARFSEWQELQTQ